MNKSYVGMQACARCGADMGVLLDRRLRDTFEYGKKYSTGHICDECKADVKEQEEAVAAGGIYFKCDECDINGAIKLSDDNRDLITYIREQAVGGSMTEPCGIGFSKCEEHEEMGIVDPAKGGGE